MHLEKGITHLPGEGLELSKTTLLVVGFEFGEYDFVVGLPGRNNVIKDAGEFMGDVFDCSDGTVSGTLTSVIIAEVGLVVGQTLSRHTKCQVDAVSGFQFVIPDVPPGTRADLGSKI